MNKLDHEHSNRLINSSSPYLLQHAYNPVDWYPWSEEALQLAKKEDKPIIVSIGYSACHWCHVMERESFENDSIAAIMNKHFINIKVDREERPDVDQVYMDAIQTMGINGGWPLNVFLTPDQKPFYGGTYFPPQQWSQILRGVADAYANNRDKLEKSAEQFTASLSKSELEKYGLNTISDPFKPEKLESMFESLSKNFDKELGGMNKAPKFPMPSIWEFLLYYYNYSKDQRALQQLELTLEQMAWGGIYDQVGGGFTRYSVDEKWFAPHFEKMLYDNGQLVSLYSKAFMLTKKTEYKKVVADTITWLEQELTDKDGGFYSALDADSEGEEGKFYVWNKEDFEIALGQTSSLMEDYFNVTDEGNWEYGNNILYRTENDVEFSKKHDIDYNEFEGIVEKSKKLLAKERSKRIRPGLDDKILLGWNALMSQGLLDAYDAFGDTHYLAMALKNIRFIEQNMREGEQLFRNYKNGKATIDAYLEDYALYIELLIKAYQATFDEHFLNISDLLAKYVISNFYDEVEGLFYYTNIDGEQLIARKKELFDNVIPSSNSILANALHELGSLLDRKDYVDISDGMLATISGMLPSNINYLSNWGKLYANKSLPTPEIVIIGTNADLFRKEISKELLPNTLILGTTDKSNLPLLEGKISIEGKTTIYVCFDKTCKLPVFTVKDAIKQIKGN